MTIKIILFDFDGTLGDTRANIVLGMQIAMQETGFPVADEESIATTIGLPAEQGYAVLIPGVPETEILRCTAAYRRIFEETLKTIRPALFPHVKETLASLKESGITLTITSSREYDSLMRFLRDMEIEEYFTYVVGADSVKEVKPKPEPVLKTLNELHISPQEALVVGDMPVDILMGKNAGAKTCAVTYGNANRETLEKTNADYIIDDFADLLQIVTDNKAN